jgi:hypothetical protein
VSLYAVAGSDTNRSDVYFNGTTVTNYRQDSVSFTSTDVSALVAGSFRASVSETPSLITVRADTNSTSVANPRLPLTGTVLYLGRYGSGATYEADGRISKVCLDPRPTRCR